MVALEKPALGRYPLLDFHLFDADLFDLGASRLLEGAEGENLQILRNHREILPQPRFAGRRYGRLSSGGFHLQGGSLGFLKSLDGPHELIKVIPLNDPGVR